jgi:hypothetical protein
MVKFIVSRIENAAISSIEDGRNKYSAFFVNTHIYDKFKDGVNTILKEDGYGDCII